MKPIICVLICVFFLIGSLQASEDRGLQMHTVQDQTGQQIGLYEGSYALLIGVSDYTEGWPDLPGVPEDIQAVKAALEGQGFQVMIAENPSRTELEQVFYDFINQYGQHPDNRLLFYFAGHGHTMTLAYGGEMGYIVPVDAPNPYQDASGFLAKAMDMQMIEVYAKRIQSKHVLFLFDSCFSGSIFALSRAVPENISYKTAKPVRQFITSGSAEEQVPDESIFRQQFIAALQGEADANGDGYVTGAELGEFLQGQVVNYSRGAQHPQYGKIRDPYLDKGDFVFPLTEAVYIENLHIESDAAQTADPETEMWELVKNSTNIADIEAFLKAFPQGRLAEVAKLKLDQLERGQDQAEPVQKDEDTALPIFEFFKDFESEAPDSDEVHLADEAHFVNEYKEEQGGFLEVIEDPTGSSRGKVLKGEVSEHPNEDDEYLIYHEVEFDFQPYPCRIQEDIWMSRSVYEDITSGKSDWYIHFELADLADWENDVWHAVVLTELWDDGYMHMGFWEENDDDDDASLYPDNRPDAPQFTPETWHTMTLEIDASGVVSFYQDDQLIVRGKLPSFVRNGLEDVAGGPLVAGSVLREGGYVLVDNFSITCGP